MTDRFAGMIGIDLGTTLSCAAYLARDGVPTTVPNREGDLLTPSVVLVEDNGVIVGREAKRTECLYPTRTAVCVKRDMGNEYFSQPLGGFDYRPEVLSGIILRRIKTDVETRLWPVDEAVITVPAYFDDTRRKATQDAGQIAGLNVLDIINEPTAAALSYAFSAHLKHGEPGSFHEFTEREMTALVYDLGGGTFDVSLVRISPNRFETLATDGDVRLGGKDWDDVIINHAADEFFREFDEDPRTDPESRAVLSLAAEQAKHALSVRSATRLMVMHAGQRLPIEITRALFDELTAPLLERTRATTDLVVESAGLVWEDVDRVLLVGGMTRMPQVRRMLRELTGLEADGSLAADEVVAHGAAIHGGILRSRGLSAADNPQLARWSNFTTIDVTAHSLGICVRTDRGYANSVLIPKNARLPATHTRLFQTHSANQRQVRIRVLQGDAPDADACLQIGEFVLENLPPNLPAQSPIEVECRYGSDGRIKVIGRDPASGRLAETTLIRPVGIPEAELKQAAEQVAQLTIG